MNTDNPKLSVEDAVILLRQQRLDELCEGATQEDCELDAAYVVLDAYLKLQRELAEAKLDAERCDAIRREVIAYNTRKVSGVDGKPAVGNLCAWADAETVDAFNAAIDAAIKEQK